jgi:hypothetical protein
MRVYLLPWEQLTRFAVPVFRVVRRDLLYDGEVLPVGTVLTPEVATGLLSRPVRLRRFYEQRLIEPVEGHISLADAARRVKQVAAGIKQEQDFGRPRPDDEDDEDDDEPLAALSLPALPVAEESPTSAPVSPPPSSGYTPGRKKKHRR